MTPRELVTRRVAARAATFPDLDLSPLDTAALDARDAALARAIDHAVARRWLTLAAVLDSRLDQSWDALQPNVQAPLLVGAAQLLLMQRLPDHAVINEAVEWTKSHARRKAGGLVNAVLRAVAALRGDIAGHSAGNPLPRTALPLEDGRVLQLAQAVFAEDPSQRLAQQTSHSDQLIGYWTATHDVKTASDLAMHSLVHAPIIVTGMDEPVDAAQFTAHEQPGFFVYTGPRDDLEELLKQHAFARVQDSGTAAAMQLSASLQPKVIIDLCAGRGTKTLQLAQLHPAATIIATDIDEPRQQALAKQFATSQRVQILPYTQVLAQREQADLLVLDVPCSNTGVLARRVEAKYRFNAVSLESIRDLQRQIVADALALLSPAGKVLYSTCSIEPIENEQQAQWIAHWHPLHIEAQASRLPVGLPGEDAMRYSDGGYAALLART